MSPPYLPHALGHAGSIFPLSCPLSFDGFLLSSIVVYVVETKTPR